MMDSWARFRAASPLPALLAEPVPAALLPLNGTSVLDRCSDSEKQKLHVLFCRFHAEVFVLLESLLLIAYRGIQKDFQEPAKRRMAGVLIRDEHRHVRAFRRFLREESAFVGEGPVLLNRGRTFRRAIVALLRRAPLSMALPGAKIEAYTVAYGHFLREHHGGNEKATQWVFLNHLHLQDERLHVPMEFDLFNAGIRLRPPLDTLIGTLIFILYLQWVMLSSASEILKRTFPARSCLTRFFLTLTFGHWVARHFPPYMEARREMRRQFQVRRPAFGWLFRFISW